jgi:cyanase
MDQMDLRSRFRPSFTVECDVHRSDISHGDMAHTGEQPRREEYIYFCSALRRRTPHLFLLCALCVSASLRLCVSARNVSLCEHVPYKGSLPTTVPTDPLIYRFHELVNVYSTTFKALIHEEFGDGIMSAIDFTMSLEREPDPKGDRVSVTMSGKFLPYKTY